MPAEIIVGIIGVETIYGRQMGNFRVIDALATLAFDFPGRPARDRAAQFFRGELETLFVLCHSERHRPAAPGAAATPAPWACRSSCRRSFNRYAVDFDGDGHIDLHRSAADVIGSVANYFKGFGWQPGMPTHFAVSFDRRDHWTRRPAGARHPADLQRAELSSAARCWPSPRGRAHGPLALVELQNGDAAPQLRRRHGELLCDHALQLVQLLRDGGDRAGARR